MKEDKKYPVKRSKNINGYDRIRPKELDENIGDKIIEAQKPMYEYSVIDDTGNAKTLEGLFTNQKIYDHEQKFKADSSISPLIVLEHINLTINVKDKTTRNKKGEVKKL